MNKNNTSDLVQFFFSIGVLAVIAAATIVSAYFTVAKPFMNLAAAQIVKCDKDNASSTPPGVFAAFFCR